MTDVFEYTSDSIRISSQKGNASLRIVLSGMTLGRAVSQVVLNDGTREEVIWTHRRRTQGELELRGTAAGQTWTLRIAPETNRRGVPGMRLQMSGTALQKNPVAALIPLSFPRLSADHILVHGRSAGGCRAYLPSPTEEAIESHSLLMIRRGERILQFAQPLQQDHPTTLSARYKKTILRDLTITTPFDPEERVGRLVAEPLSLFVDPHGHALMEAWAEAQAPEIPRPATPSVVAWNTWDYFRWTITEETVLRNAEFIAADPVLRQHVKRIIIDDGWQYAYGEWDANPLFPHGMGWIAKKLTDMGFEPGLWIAPGIVEPQARIAQWDADMLACGESGLPCLCYNCMERHGFVLDPTVPKTQRWLYDLFSRYADLGFRYFKTDFLMPVTTAPRYNDPSVPRGQIIKMLLAPIRQALAGRALIMGCGYDFHAGMEYVDEVRTSTDIHARWDSICDNVGSIAARWWAQDRWWGNDPDFALARGPETSNDPDLNRLTACYVFVKPHAQSAPEAIYSLATMSAIEARTLLALVLISGGCVTLSDDLTKLNPEGLDLIRRTVAAPRGSAGIALDLFHALRPTQWLQRTPAGSRVLLVNWEDSPRELSLDLRALGIASDSGRDFWSDAPIDLHEGRLTQTLAPHESLLVDLPNP